MKDFAINSAGNFVRVNQGFSFTTEKTDYVRQKIQIALQFFLGEWFLDTSIGIPYFDMFTKNPNTNLLRAAMKSAISRVEYVQRILSFDMTLVKPLRKLVITFKVETDTGEIVEGSI